MRPCTRHAVGSRSKDCGGWWMSIFAKYFNTIDHAHLRRFLDQRVTDGIVRRMIENG